MSSKPLSVAHQAGCGLLRGQMSLHCARQPPMLPFSIGKPVIRFDAFLTMRRQDRFPVTLRLQLSRLRESTAGNTEALI